MIFFKQRKRHIAFYFLFLASCFFIHISAQKGLDKSHVINIKLSPDSTHQIIRNFGASDAWSTQYVGKYWPEASKQAIAKLLFSKAVKTDGSPEGIGLTAWRFNIGAGSAEQSSKSRIHDDWKRAECFLNADGTYNWNKQSGQLWFIEAAKQYGVNTFVGFANSPPIFYTENQKAWSGNGVRSNLIKGNYKAYANFLAELVKGVRSKTGVTFNYISPFNEPQWDWKCCKQEGSPWTNEEIFNAVKQINLTFNNHQISSKIEITEAAKLNYLYTTADKPNRGNQIDYFFSKDSEGYVGDLNLVAKKVAGHSYFTTWGYKTLLNTRKHLKNKLQQNKSNLEFWMSEYCVLEDNNEIKGVGRDLGIDTALYLARVIHSDLVFANASAWHWWLAVSPYNYKDGLIYIDKNKYGGRFYDSKMLWALGHYSRFIKPGMYRITSSSIDGKLEEETISGVLQSAYASDNEIVVVLVNQLNQDKQVAISGVSKGFELENMYQTTNQEDMNLKCVSLPSHTTSILLPKRSLITCVFKKNQD